MMKAGDFKSRVAYLQEKAAQASAMTKTALDEDMLLLNDVNRVVAHCKRALRYKEQDPGYHSDELWTSDDSSVDHSVSTTGSSTTDTTILPTNTLPEAPDSSADSPNSMSTLEARELFPDDFDSSVSNKESDPCSSVPSTKTRTTRSVKEARAQQVQVIISEMQERMKRRDSI